MLSYVGCVVLMGVVEGHAGTERGEQPAIELAPVITDGLHNPLYVTHAGDGSGRLFVVEQVGRVTIVRNGRLLKAPFLDISARVIFGGERRLLGLAFHPDFSPAYAGSHGCEAVEECEAGVLRSRAVAKAAMARRRLGEGGHTSAGYAEVKCGCHGCPAFVAESSAEGSVPRRRKLLRRSGLKPWGSTERTLCRQLYSRPGWRNGCGRVSGVGQSRRFPDV